MVEIGNDLRKVVFFGLDAVRGGRVRRHLRELVSFEGLGADEQGALERLRLRTLLAHAADTTAIYRDQHDVDELSRWPVVNKLALQQDPMRFTSRVYRSRRLIPQWTSGSYGTPMRVLFSRDKWARRNAEVIFYNRRAGLAVGNSYLHVSTSPRSAWRRWATNTIALEATRMDVAWLERSVAVLRRHPGRVIVGFASALLALAEYVRASAWAGTIRLGGAIAAAEPLTDQARRIIGAAFQCPVFNRYASTETGVLAFSLGDNGELAVNRASYIVEVLAMDEDRPVLAGEPGRVVVTDLFSFAMPLIRYDIGDVAVAGECAGIGVRSLSRVEGRLVEAIDDAGGARVSWAAIYDIFHDATTVLQYQFCQVGDAEYRIYVIRRDGFQSRDEQKLREKLAALLGREARLDFAYVENIPALPSGKRPAITRRRAKEAAVGKDD